MSKFYFQTQANESKSKYTKILDMLAVRYVSCFTNHRWIERQQEKQTCRKIRQEKKGVEE